MLGVQVKAVQEVIVEENDIQTTKRLTKSTEHNFTVVLLEKEDSILSSAFLIDCTPIFNFLNCVSFLYSHLVTFLLAVSDNNIQHTDKTCMSSTFSESAWEKSYYLKNSFLIFYILICEEFHIQKWRNISVIRYILIRIIQKTQHICHYCNK